MLIFLFYLSDAPVFSTLFLVCSSAKTLRSHCLQSRMERNHQILNLNNTMYTFCNFLSITLSPILRNLKSEN